VSQTAHLTAQTVQGGKRLPRTEFSLATGRTVLKELSWLLNAEGKTWLFLYFDNG
jgi:hypothetical protein